VPLSAQLALTDGAVTGVHQTSASENDQTIYGIRYRYQVAEVSHQGVSYALSNRFESGQPVTVQYLVKRPDRSRIEGMRVRTFGLFAIFPILFPLVGLGVAMRGLVTGLLARRLLKIGRLAFGRLVHKEPTHTRINKQTVYRLTFEFSVPEEPKLFGYRQSAQEATALYQVHHKSHQTIELEDEPEEPLLFDPNDPHRAYPIDGLPGKVTVSSAGHIEAPQSPLKTLALPVLSVLGLVAFLVTLLSL
jgi:hypothetical protein